MSYTVSEFKQLGFNRIALKSLKLVDLPVWYKEFLVGLKKWQNISSALSEGHLSCLIQNPNKCAGSARALHTFKLCTAAPPAVNLKDPHITLIHRPVQIVTIIMHIWHSNPILRKRVNKILHIIGHLAKAIIKYFHILLFFLTQLMSFSAVGIQWTKYGSKLDWNESSHLWFKDSW